MTSSSKYGYLGMEVEIKPDPRSSVNQIIIPYAQLITQSYFYL